MQSVTIDINKEKEALAAGIHHTALTLDTLREEGKSEKDSDKVTSQKEESAPQNTPSVRVQEVDSIVVCADGGNGDGLNKDGKTMSL